MSGCSRIWRLAAAAFSITAIFAVASPKAKAITLSTTSHNYGNVFANWTSVSIPIDVTYSLGFVLDSVTVTGDTTHFYAPLNLCGVGQGDPCTMNAVFQPLGLGPFTAKVTVIECDPGGPCITGTIDLTGTGVPRFTETPIPGSLALFATGLGLLGYTVRRRRQAAALA